MPDDKRNPPIGAAPCFECGEGVTVRLNKNGRAYYFCDCGAHHRWSSASSKALRKAHREGGSNATETANDNAGDAGDAGELADGVGADRRRVGFFRG